MTRGYTKGDFESLCSKEDFESLLRFVFLTNLTLDHRLIIINNSKNGEKSKDRQILN